MLSVEPMQEADWPSVRRIYLEGIATGNATFEMAAPVWEEWDQNHRPDCRLVARLDGVVVGWAALTPVSARAVYHGVAEVSLYVAEGIRGRGVGKTLLRQLVLCSERHGVWTLQAGIFPENSASLAVHRACGFRVLGTRERLGLMLGSWRDVVLLERRSKAVGQSGAAAGLDDGGH